jgi:indolepyruvate ferredoxin oxidoreductase alpha subunit
VGNLVGWQDIVREESGKQVLLNGNEAMARGALEAGVHFVSAYPGSPSSEVTDVLAQVSENFNFYVEWSANEIVALEGAAGASFAGLRALCTMKADGLNVAFDFLTSMNLGGCQGGLVLVVADDPFGHSSLKEYDSRFLAAAAWVPVLEPSTVQEARDMVKWAFYLSEQIKGPVMVRSVTRVSHSRGIITLGDIEQTVREADFRPTRQFHTFARFHQEVRERLKQAEELFAVSPFNFSFGAEKADLTIFTCGTGWLYAKEALTSLQLEDQVKIVRLGTSFPLPQQFILSHLNGVKKVIFIEETRPFLEEKVLALYALHNENLGQIKFYGKATGHVSGIRGPECGEMNTDIVREVLVRLTGRPYHVPTVSLTKEEKKSLQASLPPRDYMLCPGCPHRASFWVVKSALALEGNNGIVTGDIGCYSMGAMETGFNLFNTLHCMGAGAGIAGGLSKLGSYGFKQPIVTLVGDSTFYHAVIPALINGRWNKANYLCIVLDNGVTAMTGHQPHPGSGKNAVGKEAEVISIEEIAKSFGFMVKVSDPFRCTEAIQDVLEFIRMPGLKVLILRQPCALVVSREQKRRKVIVRQELCRGDACGCMRFCTAVWGCPANVWDKEREAAAIDPAICVGCGVCIDLCPAGAIFWEGDE